MTAPLLERRRLCEDSVIARYEVSGRRLAIEKTAVDHEYLLLAQVPSSSAFFPLAVVSIDDAGAFKRHKFLTRIWSEDEITGLAHMAGWKIMTHRRRVGSPTPIPETT
jgi:hypothetical protein